MANTADTSKAGNILQVTYTASGADWNYATDGGFGTGPIWVKAISWKAGADGDILKIREGSNTGPFILVDEATDSGNTSGPRVIPFSGIRGTPMRPYIKLTDCTSITDATITFHLA